MTTTRKSVDQLRAGDVIMHDVHGRSTVVSVERCDAYPHVDRKITLRNSLSGTWGNPVFVYSYRRGTDAFTVARERAQLRPAATT